MDIFIHVAFGSHMLSAFTISFRLAMVSGWSESYSRLLIAYANHVLRNISPGLFQHYSSSVPHTLTHSLAVGIICYFTEMWFSGNSAERGQLGVAPSQHLSNGLEEIHSQIKQTRRKELKNNVHTHTMASWKWIILPWVTNKTFSCAMLHYNNQIAQLGLDSITSCWCSLTCEAQSWVRLLVLQYFAQRKKSQIYK